MCYYLKVEKDLVHNGLYGQFFNFMAFTVWGQSSQHYWRGLLLLIPLNYMVILVFTTGVEVMVKTVGVTPGFMPGYIVATFYVVACTVTTTLLLGLKATLNITFATLVAIHP